MNEGWDEDTSEQDEVSARYVAAIDFAAEQHKIGNTALAIQGYRSAIALKPEIPHVYVMLAQAMIAEPSAALIDGEDQAKAARRTYEEAVALVQTALGLDAGDALVQEMAARVYADYAFFECNELDDPLASIVRPIGPPPLMLLISLALLGSQWLLLRRQRKSPACTYALRAEEHYKRAIEMTPEDDSVHTGIFTLYANLPVYFPHAARKGAEHLAMGLAAAPNDADILGMIAWHAAHHGSLRQGRAWALAALEQDPTQTDALNAMAVVLMTADGDFAEGFDHALQVLDQDHANLAAQVALHYGQAGRNPFLRWPLRMVLLAKRQVQKLRDIQPFLPLGLLIGSLLVMSVLAKMLEAGAPGLSRLLYYAVPVPVSIYNLVEYYFLVRLGLSVAEEVTLEDF